MAGSLVDVSLAGSLAGRWPSCMIAPVVRPCAGSVTPRSAAAFQRLLVHEVVAALHAEAFVGGLGARILGFNYDTGERYLSVPDFLPE